MWKRLLLLLTLGTSAAAPGRDKADNWIKVQSPHFVVATNSGEREGRRIADHFERMRSVFRVIFPKLQLDPGAPIIVLAVKNERDFRTLEPEAYLAKGQLKLGGLFLHAPETNYVLMRLDAEGEHPYSVVYHEYTHLILGKAAEWMPLWLNEGLAEFYENSDIEEHDAAMGQTIPEHIFLLRQRRLLPLATLLRVDANSPYYHQEDKGSMFYAESWALVHYLEVKDYVDKGHRLTKYGDLLASGSDPLTAAAAAFGDLKQLENDLNNYLQQGRFSYFRVKTTTEVDDAAFLAQPLPPAQADALRADFLAHNQRTADAKALLDHVLQEDPNNVIADETMGFLALHEHNLEEAKKWYEQAVQLDSQSYLARYYFAFISMLDPLSPSEETKVENSLRQAVKLNPSFAPAFDRLAVFLARRHRDLDEAHMMGLTAVSLDPGNVGYRVNTANVLMVMGRGDDAVQVLRNAEKLAKSPQELGFVEEALMNAQVFAESGQRKTASDNEDDDSDNEPPAKADSAEPPIPHLVRRPFVPSGPHRFVTGVIQNVRCGSSEMDLSVQSAGKATTLHSDNFYQIQFSTLGFQPAGEIKPCSDLEGKPAKVEYVESANKTDTPHVIAVELHK